jgi:hypothetical protein
MFYKVPDDLKTFEAMVGGLGQHMAGEGVFTPPGLVAELSAEVAQEAKQVRSRLIEENREHDLKALREHLISVGKFMDNAHYNHLYYPFIMATLPKK